MSTEAQLQKGLLKFPPEMRPIVVQTIEGLSAKISPNTETHWCTAEAHIEASYSFARRIDPNYRSWEEKDNNYQVNLETEKYLIMFYELANKI